MSFYVRIYHYKSRAKPTPKYNKQPQATDTAMIFAHHSKVYINHTDAGGIVYHANHLTFFEHARREWLSSLGIDRYFLSDDGDDKVHFVVSHIAVDYILPLLLDDILCITIDDVTPKNARLILTQSIYREHTKASCATVTLVCVKNSPQGIRPVRLPITFTDKLLHQQSL